MKRVASQISMFAGIAILAMPAFADHHAGDEAPKPKVEIVSVDDEGRPDVVKIDGIETAICRGDRTDGCINPRDAGLDEGGTQINYWPCRPASEIDVPLPVEKPENEFNCKN